MLKKYQCSCVIRGRRWKCLSPPSATGVLHTRRAVRALGEKEMEISVHHWGQRLDTLFVRHRQNSDMGFPCKLLHNWFLIQAIEKVKRPRVKTSTLSTVTTFPKSWCMLNHCDSMVPTCDWRQIKQCIHLTSLLFPKSPVCLLRPFYSPHSFCSGPCDSLDRAEDMESHSDGKEKTQLLGHLSSKRPYFAFFLRNSSLSCTPSPPRSHPPPLRSSISPNVIHLKGINHD